MVDSRKYLSCGKLSWLSVHTCVMYVSIQITQHDIIGFLHNTYRLSTTTPNNPPFSCRTRKEYFLRHWIHCRHIGRCCWWSQVALKVVSSWDPELVAVGFGSVRVAAVLTGQLDERLADRGVGRERESLFNAGTELMSCWMVVGFGERWREHFT